jgi:hypothetical protein
MTNKQKQAHVARVINNGSKRLRLQVLWKRRMKPNAFANLWRCRKGACRKLSK